jgi:hypothetical protein
MVPSKPKKGAGATRRAALDDTEKDAPIRDPCVGLSEVKAVRGRWADRLAMTQTLSPFSIVRPLASKLDAVLSYWQNLRRGEAEIPFSDDLSMPSVKQLCSDVFLLDVFAAPERFRLSTAEIGLAKETQDQILGRFIDEVDLPDPFDLLRAQSSATVEEMRPTVYRHERTSIDGEGYERLLLPTWGEGRVLTLLGAVQRG